MRRSPLSMLCLFVVVPTVSFGTPGGSFFSNGVSAADLPARPVLKARPAPVISAEHHVVVSIDGGRVVIESSDPQVEVVVADGGRRVLIRDLVTQVNVALLPLTFELAFDDARGRLAIEGNGMSLKRENVVIARITRHIPDLQANSVPSPPSVGTSPFTRKFGGSGGIRPVVPVQPEPQPPMTVPTHSDATSLPAEPQLSESLKAMFRSPRFGRGPSPELVRAAAAVEAAGGRISIGRVDPEHPASYVGLAVFPIRQGGPALVDAACRLPGLQTIRIFDQSVDDRSVELLSEVTTLEDVALMNALITPEALHHLSHLPRLRSLEIGSSNQVCREGLKYLKGHPTLSSLSLYNQKLANEDMESIASFTSLEHLKIYTTSSEVPSLEPLARLQHFKSLMITGLALGDKDLQSIGHLGALESLSVAGSSHVTSDGVMHLTGLKNLQSLTLNDTSVDDRGIEHLRELPALSHLSLAGSKVTGKCIPTLLSCSALRSIAFKPEQFSVDETKALVEGLPAGAVINPLGRQILYATGKPSSSQE